MDNVKEIYIKYSGLLLSINYDKKIIEYCRKTKQVKLRKLAEIQLLFHSSYRKFLYAFTEYDKDEIDKYYELTKKYALSLLELSENYDENYYLKIAEKIKVFYEFSTIINNLFDNGNLYFPSNISIAIV